MAGTVLLPLHACNSYKRAAAETVLPERLSPHLGMPEGASGGAVGARARVEEPSCCVLESESESKRPPESREPKEASEAKLARAGGGASGGTSTCPTAAHAPLQPAQEHAPFFCLSSWR